jgi:putative oxidoreductase
MSATNTVSTVAAWLLAALFALAGALKLADPAAFAADIGNYRLVSVPVAAALALWLPWFEITLALALFLPRWRPAAATLAAGLLLVFCATLGSVLWRGIDLECGCFGRENPVAPAWALARNAGLLALAALAARGRGWS